MAARHSIKRSPIRQRLVASAIVYAALLGLVAWAGNMWADARAVAQAGTRAQAAATARASLLVSELQKYRLIPVVLGEYPDVASALRGGAAAAVRLDDKLDGLSGTIGSSIIYLLDARGRTIAASNWRLPTSFVGQDYSFRPYFTQARAKGAAEFFGLGTVSRRPGLFLSRRVGDRAAPGVVVVKFGFDAIERGWAAIQGIGYVTDGNGVVVVTDYPAWRFRTERRPGAPAIAAMRRARQFGDAPLDPLPLARAADGLVMVAGARPGDRRYATATIAVPVAGWRLTTLEPVAPLRAGYLATARLAIAVAAVLLLLPLAAWNRARERAELAAAGRAALERQVIARTAALEDAQARFRDAREALAHANRLGSIGQITAAVTHEINQPVAAIRSFAENAVVLLDRGEAATARANLGAIAALTDRIGAIAAELKGYARRGSGTVRPASLDAAIEGAILMTGHRLRQAGIGLRRDGARDIVVLGDPVRLEQILVNLIGNAMLALDGVAAPSILLRAEAAGGDVRLLLADNGVGIDPTMRDRLFTPFATSRADGLGLGLAIARDIARDFGGELDCIDPPPGWRTAFLMRLRAA